MTNEQMFELLFDHAKTRGAISKAWWEEEYIMPAVSAFERGKKMGEMETLEKIKQFISDEKEDEE